jgi:hypothetical protein
MRIGRPLVILVALAACAVVERPRLPAPRSTPPALAPTGGSIRIIERRQYWVNFVPFGAGQLQNGRRGKAIAFAATQGVAAATSVGIFVHLVNRYGWGGTVPSADAAEVRRLQQIQIGAGVVFVGLAVWGVVDSLRDYEPVVEIGPTVIGNGMGVAIEWRP